MPAPRLQANPESQYFNTLAAMMALDAGRGGRFSAGNVFRHYQVYVTGRSSVLMGCGGTMRINDMGPPCRWFRISVHGGE
jgi:hypothetical protein